MIPKILLDQSLLGKFRKTILLYYYYCKKQIKFGKKSYKK